MKAQSITRKPRQRAIRAAKTGTAAEAIGKIAHNCEIYVLTFGQFSLIDAICALIEQTGPAHVTLATWTAASVDLRRAKALLEASDILSMRFIVDRSFLTRVPEYCADMRRLFGDDCIRTARTHAKFAIIHNDQWRIVMRTSMNLNHNPRLENLEISEGPEFFDFMQQVTEDLFNEIDEGDLTHSPMPLLDNIDNVPLPGRIAAKPIPADDLRSPAAGTIQF